ncbi:MAG: TrkH family potassium uptake protein, partial [Candidatus Methanomethylophilaceae archaeon]|nr:TrkH family potassium uptake protein [Candidatus Methanomethylophilaceae archaeon]
MDRGTKLLISVRANIRRRYERIPKRESRVMLILGIVLFFTSLMLLPSTVMAYNLGDDFLPFLVPMVAGLVASVYMSMKFELPNNMRPADGLMMIFAVWILLFAFGTIPFLMSGMTFVDAFFESVSGFTTTGATIITDVEATPKGLLLWRAITNWIGGIIIVMMFMFIIPMVISGGRGLLKNEMSGSGGGNLTMKLGSAAKQFIAMYVILTAIFAGVLLVQSLSLL